MTGPGGGCSDLLATARAWQSDDPDPRTRAELDALIRRAEAADQSAVGELADRFAGVLDFGTAGLRGAMGAGPNRMNRSLVIRAAAGLTAYLRQERARQPGRQHDGGSKPTVVVGFDARRNSEVFAQDTAAVVSAAGGTALLLPRPLPTPVLAFAVRHLAADAGVMVTASHNPAADNGYKVYLADGGQVAPPQDAAIAACMAGISRSAAVPRAASGWQVVGEDLVREYAAAAAAVVAPGGARDLTVVHTALHGVGSDLVADVFARAGFARPVPVESQRRPDPDFPTVAFPNPEEPGAMDEALAVAAQVGPDLVLASDPDADRCAAAVPVSLGHRWRLLTGDEVGALLGAHVLARGIEPGQVVASSIVSSRLLAKMAQAEGVGHVLTLTGFKWIARVPGLRYGYEEALGYCLAPGLVRDKDGITAAVCLAELAAWCKAQGRTLLDVLDDLALRHGSHTTSAVSVRVSDPGLIAAVMARLRRVPPHTVGGLDVVSAQDLAAGVDGLPPTDGVRYLLADGSRVVVRPSGTEPKVKVYLEVVLPVADACELVSARRTAAHRLQVLSEAMRALVKPA